MLCWNLRPEGVSFEFLDLKSGLLSMSSFFEMWKRV